MIAPAEGLFWSRIVNFNWPFYPIPRPSFRGMYMRGRAKGRIRWIAGLAQVEVRSSLGDLITSGAWLIGILVWGLISLSDPQLHAAGVIALIAGPLVVLTLEAFTISRDRRRIRQLVDELETWLRRAAV